MILVTAPQILNSSPQKAFLLQQRKADLYFSDKVTASQTS